MDKGGDSGMVALDKEVYSPDEFADGPALIHPGIQAGEPFNGGT